MVACMDARIDPAKVLGIGNGEAHVIRNGQLFSDWTWFELTLVADVEQLVGGQSRRCGQLSFHNSCLGLRKL